MTRILRVIIHFDTDRERDAAWFHCRNGMPLQSFFALMVPGFKMLSFDSIHPFSPIFFEETQYGGRIIYDNGRIFEIPVAYIRCDVEPYPTKT